jgi:spore coat protein U-like protein
MRMSHREFRLIGCALAALLVSARVEAAGCTVSTTSVNFGAYDVFTSSPTDSTGVVTYNCAAHSSVTISLTKGSSSTFSPRTQTSGSNTLNYNLYRDAARTTIWGDGTSGTQVYTNTDTSNGNVRITVYGRIPAAQDVGAGSYTDSVTAVINF